jgi:phosphoribosylformimino-5-aminoimidazole carboxamide ribotide isomerase
MISIIPAIDIIDGKCVRLTKGDYAQKTIYNENPLEVAKSFEGAGITHLHLVDLDGAKKKEIVNLNVLERIASGTNLQIDFGGGIQSDASVTSAFSAGAAQITAGSIAVKNAELVERWLYKFGASKIILGADAKEEMIAISGWEEKTEVSIYDFVKKWVGKGVQYCLSTDVAKDGMLEGPSFGLYRALKEQSPSLNIIASGGVSSIADIEALNEQQLYGVVVGKAIYEGRISIEEINAFNKRK